MLRIGFSGAPGSGKTSTARVLAGTARAIPELKRVELVQEYARFYLQRRPITSLWQQLKITTKQIEWEEKVPKHDTDLIVTDSPVHLGFIYAAELGTHSEDDTELMCDIFEKMAWLNSPFSRT